MKTQRGRKILAVMLVVLVLTACLSLFVNAEGTGTAEERTGVCYLVNERDDVGTAEASLSRLFAGLAEDGADNIELVTVDDESKIEEYEKNIRKDATSSMITISGDDEYPVITFLTRDYDFGAYDISAAADAISEGYALEFINHNQTNEFNVEAARRNLEYSHDIVNPSNMYATFWALVPPIIAIALALITKEVYSSLFIGMLAGALFYANFNFEGTIKTLFLGATNADGGISGGMIAKLSDTWNVGILIFLVVLGVMVALMNRAGGSAAYGKWAASKIKSKRGAQLATFGLGALIFIDDYFNCLTVGSVMRPVTDKFKISRAKLAYIIDATAAPVCIIAPISSWAAAVTGVVEGEDGLSLFIRSIPFNFYALLTIIMIIVISIMKLDFGPMKKHEDNAEKGDLYTTPDRPYENAEETYISARGRILDLVLPVILLIICCIIGMVYTGGFFSGESFIDAFANCDASLGLVYGSIAALILTFILYIPRRVLSFREFMEAFPKGFSAMVPAILILTFAWTLGGITNLLGADVYVEGLLKAATESGAAWVTQLLPAMVFAIALGLAFSTGTSWGTFGILLPIIVPVLPAGSTLLVISISACLAGAVCGDHISPISDTTIMASAGAQSNHINHVSTQIPYAMLVAGVSFVCYLLAGFVQNWFVVFPIAVVLLISLLVLIKKTQLSRELKTSKNSK